MRAYKSAARGAGPTMWHERIRALRDEVVRLGMINNVNSFFEESKRTNKSSLTRIENMKKLIGSVIKPAQAASAETTSVPPPKRLIISSGDVSDADGFLALAVYAASGADVLFVMNYPAFLQDEWNQDKTNIFDSGQVKREAGLGYKFSAKMYALEKTKIDPEILGINKKFYFQNLKNHYYSQTTYVDSNSRVQRLIKSNYSSTAKKICQIAFNSCKTNDAQNLFFMEGGVNALNAFSANATADDIYLYEEPLEKIKYQYKQDKTLDDVRSMINNYSEVYMDFNGSMAFFDDEWKKFVEQLVSEEKLKAVCVMGGVIVGEVPKTIPSKEDVLNRFSCSTMNQFYHPERSCAFLQALGEKTPVYVVPNNIVHEFQSKTFYDDILAAIGATASDDLKSVLDAYYSRPSVIKGGRPPAKKPFDAYAAIALTSLMGQAVHPERNDVLFCDATYGSTFVVENGDAKGLKNGDNATQYQQVVDWHYNDIYLDKHIVWEPYFNEKVVLLRIKENELITKLKVRILDFVHVFALTPPT